MLAHPDRFPDLVESDSFEKAEKTMTSRADKIAIDANIILVKEGLRPRFLADHIDFFNKHPVFKARILEDPDLELKGNWVCRAGDDYPFVNELLFEKHKEWITQQKNLPSGSEELPPSPYKEDHMERGKALGIPKDAIAFFQSSDRKGVRYSLLVSQREQTDEGMLLHIGTLFCFIHKDESQAHVAVEKFRMWHSTLLRHGYGLSLSIEPL